MRNPKILNLGLLLIAIGVFGCSKKTDVVVEPVTPRIVEFSGQKFVALEGVPVLTNDGYLGGDTKLIAVNPLQTTESIVTALTDLGTDPKAEIRFFTYTDKSLKGGVETVFNLQPTASDASSSLKFFSRSGSTFINADLRGASLVGGKAALGMELYPRHGHGHVLVDSAEVTKFEHPPVDGIAKYWGIQITSAVVENISIALGDPDHAD